MLWLVLASLWCAAGQKRKPGRPPDAEVLEAAAHRSEGRIAIDGRVRNCGLKPIRRLTLLFHFMAPGGQVITTQRGIIQEEVLERDEESEFRWTMKDHVRAVEFRIEAVDGSGRELVLVKAGPYPVE